MRIDGARDIPLRRHGDNFKPLVIKFFRIQYNPVRNNNQRRPVAFPRVKSQIPFAPCGDEPDIGIFQAVLLKCLNDRFRQLLPRERDFEHQRFGGFKEPVEMFLQFEHKAVIRTDPFKDPVSIQKAMVKHRNFRVLFLDQFAVDIDF